MRGWGRGGRRGPGAARPRLAAEPRGPPVPLLPGGCGGSGEGRRSRCRPGRGARLRRWPCLRVREVWGGEAVPVQPGPAAPLRCVAA